MTKYKNCVCMCSDHCFCFLTVFLRTPKSLESVDPQFTMRRKMEQLREELELMEQLREVNMDRHTHTLTHSSNTPIITREWSTFTLCIYVCAVQSIESRLKVVLPEDLGSSLMDGVVLCHLANHVRPRSVASIHVPSPAVVRYPEHTHTQSFWSTCAE